MKHDTDMVKKIKESNLLDENDILETENMIITPGSMGVICDMIKDFTYKNAYIKKRDQIIRNTFVDGQEIDFLLNVQKPFNYDLYYMNQKSTIKPNSFIDQYKNNQNNQNVMNEYDYDEDSDDNYLYYDLFIKNNHSIKGLNLLHEDEIILKCSYINLLFNYPCYTPKTTFRIEADNEMEGFTFGELALKAMQFYHLLFDLYKHYDVQKGIYSIDMEPDQHCYFRPVAYIGEWDDNGLRSLKYNKETDTWEFNCITYI